MVKFKNIKTRLDSTDIFTFGKFSGETVHSVCKITPAYIQWCLNNTNAKFTEEVIGMANTAMLANTEVPTSGEFRFPVIFDDIPF